MVYAVRNGRSGTAMVSFASVASADETEAVVSSTRNNFMRGDRQNIIYHTGENSGEYHQRNAAAFPFVNGSIPVSNVISRLKRNQSNQTPTHL
jgi:hypothetical protein